MTTLTNAQIDDIERQLGVALPGLYRKLLIEVGFGTNAAEARYLSSASGQDQLASAIAAATMEYLRRYERRVGGSRALP
jgi:N-acetylmuramoyl-L-alanine amidase